MQVILYAVYNHKPTSYTEFEFKLRCQYNPAVFFILPCIVD